MKKILLIFLCLLLVSCQKIETSTPVHSVYYNEKYSVEEAIESFNEIVLDNEYSSGEVNSRLVQR